MVFSTSKHLKINWAISQTQTSDIINVDFAMCDLSEHIGSSTTQSCVQTFYIVSIKSKKRLNVTFEDTTHQIIPNLTFHLITDKTQFSIQRFMNFPMASNLGEIIDFVHVGLYGEPGPVPGPGPVSNPISNQIVYSFDSKYFVGAFASIYSLITNCDVSVNTNSNPNPNTNINMILPVDDYKKFLKHFEIFYKKILDILDMGTGTGAGTDPDKITHITFGIYLTTQDIIPSYVKETKCFKGGNHLLNMGNYSRLIIGHILPYDIVLYIDSDTVIQKNVLKVFSNVYEKFVVMGKRSHLNYNNLFNSNNRCYFETVIKTNNCSDIEELFRTNVIYTGTMIINPRGLRKRFGDIMSILRLHNSIGDKGGLYKLFTMSLINIGLFGKLKYMDEYLVNIVDLGCNRSIDEKDIEEADVLDWSGIYKPWYVNGLYQKYWAKYNIMFDICESVTGNKNTVEEFDV